MCNLYLLSCRYPFSPDQEIPETDWEVYLRETAHAIVSQQSPQRSEKYTAVFTRKPLHFIHFVFNDLF